MCVSAFRPTTQHFTDHGDQPTQLGIATPAFDLGFDSTPEQAALPSIFAVAAPQRTTAPVVTVTTERVVVAGLFDTQLARGPPV
jgi:hypothetical protein